VWNFARPALAGSLRETFGGKLVAVCGVCLLWLTVGYAQKPGIAPAKRTLRNPVPATPASIADGREAYNKYCSHCHGSNGAGDGRFAPKDPSPPDLTDAKWDRGSSEADIFSVIWNGPAEKGTMKPLKGRVPEKDVWNIVNFVRSIGPQTRAR
jgi:mono/diheme cytochrome c family protein